MVHNSPGPLGPARATDLVAFSVENCSPEVLADNNFVEGSTYSAEFGDPTILKNFVIGDLDHTQNDADSCDGNYYTFNCRDSNCFALSKCGLLYEPDRTFESCIRSVKIEDCYSRKTGHNGCEYMYLATGLSDVENNRRLFGSPGDSGSYMYYIRKGDRARVVVGYLSRAFSHHLKCRKKSIDCIASPVKCFREVHKNCSEIAHCHQNELANCIRREDNYIKSLPKCNTCPGHEHCHLHCHSGCSYKTKQRWTFVHVLPMRRALSLLFRNLCEVDGNSSCTCTLYFIDPSD